MVLTVQTRSTRAVLVRVLLSASLTNTAEQRRLFKLPRPLASESELIPGQISIMPANEASTRALIRPEEEGKSEFVQLDFTC